MRWILQSNLYAERGYDGLLAALERRGLPVTFVRPVPFTTKLLPGDFVLDKPVGTGYP